MGYVAVKIHTDNLQGIVSKSVALRTNDPVSPQVSLTIKVEVQVSVQVLPGEAMLLRARAGQPAAGRLLIRKDPSETGELKVTDAKPSAPWFSVTATRLSAATPRGDDGLPAGSPGDWVLEAKMNTDAPVVQGRRRETVTFATGLPRQPKATVAVIVDLKPPVSFATDKLTLTPEVEGGAAGNIFVSIRPDLDPAALRVEARPEGLQASVEPSTSPRILTLSVRWKGGPLSGGLVTLTVGDEKVRLPVEVKPAGARPPGPRRPRSEKQ